MVDGCANGGVNGKRCVALDDTTELHGVRCCEEGQANTCATPGPACSDAKKKSMAEAADACSSLGKRMCTADELMAETCCGSGCGLDKKFVWSTTSCNLN